MIKWPRTDLGILEVLFRAGHNSTFLLLSSSFVILMQRAPIFLSALIPLLDPWQISVLVVRARVFKLTWPQVTLQTYWAQSYFPHSLILTLKMETFLSARAWCLTSFWRTLYWRQRSVLAPSIPTTPLSHPTHKLRKQKPGHWSREKVLSATSFITQLPAHLPADIIGLAGVLQVQAVGFLPLLVGAHGHDGLPPPLGAGDVPAGTEELCLAGTLSKNCRRALWHLRRLQTSLDMLVVHGVM